MAVEMAEARGSSPTNLLLGDDAGAIAWLQLFGGEDRGNERHASLMVAADEGPAADELVSILRDALASPEPADHLVRMTFWARSPQGPRQMPRVIEAPCWEDIAGNYAATARSDLDRLVSMTELQSGRLILWQGPPGTGQALSRLLNVSDGLLGQGLNLCTLITTNEPVERLHPAVRRPGRCLAQVEVPPLEPETANRWLEGRNGGAPIAEPITLAELFAKAERRTEVGVDG